MQGTSQITVETLIIRLIRVDVPGREEMAENDNMRWKNSGWLQYVVRIRTDITHFNGRDIRLKKIELLQTDQQTL